MSPTIYISVTTLQVFFFPIVCCNSIKKPSFICAGSQLLDLWYHQQCDKILCSSICLPNVPWKTTLNLEWNTWMYCITIQYIQRILLYFFLIRIFVCNVCIWFYHKGYRLSCESRNWNSCYIFKRSLLSPSLMSCLVKGNPIVIFGTGIPLFWSLCDSNAILLLLYTLKLLLRIQLDETKPWHWSICILNLASTQPSVIHVAWLVHYNYFQQQYQINCKPSLSTEKNFIWPYFSDLTSR